MRSNHPPSRPEAGSLTLPPGRIRTNAPDRPEEEVALRTHVSHWGAFGAEVRGGRLVGVRPHPQDPDPSPLIGNFLDSLHHPVRIRRPMFREGWLERGPGADAKRGRERFVEVPWPRALDLLAGELRRVYGESGAGAVFGASYGWSSAGRFHHAQSQVHRFLNALGGYVRSVGTYSEGAAELVLSHVLGVGSFEYSLRHATSFENMAEHTELVVAFGGIPLKNSAVRGGGMLRHANRGHLEAMRERGARFVYFSPIRADMPRELEAQWHPLRPASDTAVMLALAHVLASEGLHRREFLSRWCAGWEPFERYLMGRDDGRPKDPRWAERLSGVPASAIEALARRMAAKRTMINTSWSLQRAEHGEQPLWMSIVLAAMLGQIGLPGGGIGHGYGRTAGCGASFVARMPALPQGENGVRDFIPCARIADMLLAPGAPFEFDGRRLAYPGIRLVYWCGGNPFHHHQDLFRLREAFTRPDTVVTHEPFWTATARHADIVLPCTTTLERNDLTGGGNGAHMFAMPQLMPPQGESRNDYAIFAALAERLGVAPAFTEGRDEMQWVEALYEGWRAAAQKTVAPLPPFAEFWAQGLVKLEPLAPSPQVFLAEFRRDPEAHPLATPSGRIEIFSAEIAGFGYEECPGHPVWREPREWLGAPLARRFPIQLVANNPATRLHSQLDHGRYSAASKVNGREPVLLHPADARARGIAGGDVVRIYNERGSCLAGAVLSDDLMPSVAQLSTGAWFDPQTVPGVGELCAHGNPNVLTADRPSSRLSQGCSGQLALVEIERLAGEAPAVRAWVEPEIKRGG